MKLTGSSCHRCLLAQAARQSRPSAGRCLQLMRGVRIFGRLTDPALLIRERCQFIAENRNRRDEVGCGQDRLEDGRARRRIGRLDQESGRNVMDAVKPDFGTVEARVSL